MVKVYFGNKGMGKTVRMIESANSVAAESEKTVIFIDSGKELICSLNHKIRFIDIQDFPIKGSKMLEGYIYGIISSNYDIGSIFIDGLRSMTGEEPDKLADFFSAVKVVSDESEIDFFISLSGSESEIPDYLKEYITL